MLRSAEEKPNMSIVVKQIDTYGIEERLRKSKTQDDKEVYHYIKKLKEALKRQQELTTLAISKLKKESQLK